jgi:glyoxylate utilization-related uncharacterized protein
MIFRCFISLCCEHFIIYIVHLFYNQYGGFSFTEHADDTNVLLYIVKGSKKIYIDKHPVLVKEEQAVFIPKGLKHKVDSLSNTSPTLTLISINFLLLFGKYFLILLNSENTKILIKNENIF